MKKICYGTVMMLVLSYSALQAQDEIVEMAETPVDNSTMVVSKEDIPYTVTQPFIRPVILPDDIMYRKAVWRRLDGKEKINQSFFTFQNEITKLIIESVKTGTLQPYKNDSLTTRMSKEEFLENLKVPGMDDPTKTDASAVDPFGSDDAAWGNNSSSTDKKSKEKVSNEFLPREVTVLEIKEDVIFDKRRSRMDIRMHSVTLVVPAERLATGIDRVLATFSYADLEKLFRENPDKAIWFNAYNSKEHKNYADAFELRLFKARIYKIEEPSGDDLATIYPDLRAALIASELKELELMEYEHNLWEY